MSPSIKYPSDFSLRHRDELRPSRCLSVRIAEQIVHRVIDGKRNTLVRVINVGKCRDNLCDLLTVQAEQYRPVMVGLQYFFQLNIAWGEVMAYLTLITVPVLAFYLLLQRAFIASIASTGIKG